MIKYHREFVELVSDVSAKVAKGSISMAAAKVVINKELSTIDWMDEPVKEALEGLRNARLKAVFAEHCKAIVEYNPWDSVQEEQEQDEADHDEYAELDGDAMSVVIELDGVAAHIQQREREEKSKRYAQEKAREKQKRLAAMGLLGDLDGSNSVVDNSIDQIIEGFESFLQQDHHALSNTKKVIPLFQRLEPEDRAVLISDCLDSMLNSVDTVSVATIIHRLGDLVETSYNYISLRAKDKERTAAMKKFLQQATNSGDHVKKLRYSLRVNNQVWVEWPQEVKVMIGQVLFYVITTSCDLFQLETREVTLEESF